MFRVGMKVVCICDDYENSPPPHAVLHRIYTVSEIIPIPFWGRTALQFEELRFEETPRWYPGFDSAWFRPVVERKTDISCFEKLLDRVPERV